MIAFGSVIMHIIASSSLSFEIESVLGIHDGEAATAAALGIISFIYFVYLLSRTFSHMFYPWPV